MKKLYSVQHVRYLYLYTKFHTFIPTGSLFILEKTERCMRILKSQNAVFTLTEVA